MFFEEIFVKVCTSDEWTGALWVCGCEQVAGSAFLS